MLLCSDNLGGIRAPPGGAVFIRAVVPSGASSRRGAVGAMGAPAKAFGGQQPGAEHQTFMDVLSSSGL